MSTAQEEDTFAAIFPEGVPPKRIDCTPALSLQREITFLDLVEAMFLRGIEVDHFHCMMAEEVGGIRMYHLNIFYEIPEDPSFDSVTGAAWNIGESNRIWGTLEADPKRFVSVFADEWHPR